MLVFVVIHEGKNLAKIVWFFRQSIMIITKTSNIKSFSFFKIQNEICLNFYDMCIKNKISSFEGCIDLIKDVSVRNSFGSSSHIQILPLSECV